MTSRPSPEFGVTVDHPRVSSSQSRLSSRSSSPGHVTSPPYGMLPSRSTASRVRVRFGLSSCQRFRRPWARLPHAPRCALLLFEHRCALGFAEGTYDPSRRPRRPSEPHTHTTQPHFDFCATVTTSGRVTTSPLGALRRSSTPSPGCPWILRRRPPLHGPSAPLRGVSGHMLCATLPPRAESRLLLSEPCVPPRPSPGLSPGVE